MARYKYDTSEEALREPVSVEEADALLRVKGRPLGRRYALPHFLYRVRVTVSTQAATIGELRKTVDRLRGGHGQRLGTPTTLSPLDAVKFASPEELSTIVGHINSTQLNALQTYVAEARARRDALAHDLAAIRSATNQVLKRDDLPHAARTEFVRLLNSLPATPAPVPTPPALEMAHVVGLIDKPDEPPAPAPLPDADPPAAPGTDLRTRRPVALLPQYGALPAWQPATSPTP